jgi:hypothetical protein
MSATFTSQVFEFCQVETAAAGAPVVPSKIVPPPGPGTPSTFAAWPFGNVRQMVILNRGANPLLFGVEFFKIPTDWPSNFGGAGPALVLTEGFNCTRIPAGGSLTIDLGSYQERGDFTSPGFNTAAPVVPLASYFPFNFISFASTAAGVTNADIFYVARMGQF